VVDGIAIDVLSARGFADALSDVIPEFADWLYMSIPDRGIAR